MLYPHFLYIFLLLYPHIRCWFCKKVSIIGREVDLILNKVGVADLAPLGKFMLEGPGATKFLSSMVANTMPKVISLSDSVLLSLSPFFFLFSMPPISTYSFYFLVYTKTIRLSQSFNLALQH